MNALTEIRLTRPDGTKQGRYWRSVFMSSWRPIWLAKDWPDPPVMHSLVRHERWGLTNCGLSTYWPDREDPTRWGSQKGIVLAVRHAVLFSRPCRRCNWDDQP